MVRIKNRVVIKAALLALLVFAASGCNDNLLRPKAEKAKAEVTKTESKLYRVEGYFEQKGAVPAAFNSTAEGQNARTAMPNMAGIEYSIKAENETTTYSSDNSGNIQIDDTSFTLALPQGTWTITVEGKLPGSTSACVVGSTKVTLSAENPVAQVNIAVKPSMNGTGSVALTVGVEDDSGIKGVEWRLDGLANRSEFINFTSNSATINLQDIESGSYTLVMEFYSGSEDDEGQLLYMVRESVNVFDGATTDTWSGNSPYLRDGIFTVRKELVETFAQTTFYVSSGGNDNNSGSLPSLPLATIQNAVDKAVAMNAVLPSDEDTPYRILLLSNVTCDGTASFAGNNNAFVNITPAESLHLVIEPYKKDVATIDANRDESNSGRVMYIGENAKVTMNSLTITGGHITADGGGVGGGGVYNAGTLTMNDCTISSNTVTCNGGSVYGGGIYCSGKAPKVILDGGSIKNNTVGSESFQASAYGGGISSVTGTVTISDAIISENKAISSSDQAYGGGLYLIAGTTAEISGNSKISNNSANFGGGIYISSSNVTITSATVSSNRSTDNGSGGGIYFWGGSLITTGMVLDSNTSSSAGGGIYIYSRDSSCKITGGTISGNEAMAGGGIHISASANVTIVDASISGNSSTNTSGGGIYISSGSLTTTDMTLDNNTAKTVGGGIRIEGGTVTITGGTISGNVATNGAGGGVSNDSNCTLDSVELRDNQAKATDGNGGAISNLGGATLTLNGGTIEGNTAAGNGGAIYNNGTLKVQGALSIPCGETGEHDVYLFNSENNIMTPITITGDLATEGTVATITPGNYTPDVQVLQASNVTLATQVGKFDVTPQSQGDGSSTAWYISPEGNLTTKFPASRLSEDNYGDITEIMVGSAGDMNKISELAQSKKTFEDKTITLQGNVTLDENYVPIEKFSGRFDGNNKTITLPEGNPITALFTKVEGKNDSKLAEVKDLMVEGEATKAGIADEATYAKISECTSNVDVTHDSGMFEDVGGIVATLRADCIVEDCKNNGSISPSAYSAYVGGIVGYVYNTSQILNCINEGSVSGTGEDSYVGGIVGAASICYVVNCGNEGPVAGSAQESNEDTRVGGIAGMTKVSSGSEGIYNCYNIESVSGGMYTGGIVGDFGDSNSYGAYVCNTYNSGSVSSDVSGANIGGVIGRNNAGNQGQRIANNFYYKANDASYIGVGTDTDDDDTKTTAMTSTTATDKSSELNNWRNDNKLTDINGHEIDYKTWTYDSANAYCKFVEED